MEERKDNRAPRQETEVTDDMTLGTGRANPEDPAHGTRAKFGVPRDREHDTVPADVAAAANQAAYDDVEAPYYNPAAYIDTAGEGPAVFKGPAHGRPEHSADAAGKRHDGEHGTGKAHLKTADDD